MENGGWLKIDDWEGLKAAGEFDPEYLHLRPAEGASRSRDGGNSHRPVAGQAVD